MQVKRSVALADVALGSAMEEHPQTVAVHADGRAVSLAQWRRMVSGWHASFTCVPGEEIGFYFDDALAFSAALWGAWHAGKTPVLLSDQQPATLSMLLPTVSATAGLLPGAVVPREGGASGDIAMPPFDMQRSHLVLFTSGSTGRPERIAKKVTQLDAEVHALEAAFASKLNGRMLRVLATVSHQHIYGLLFRILWPLSARRAIGTRLCRYPEELVQQFDEAQDCMLVSSPAVLGRLPAHLPWDRARAGLKAVFSSGGPLTAEAADHTLTVLGCSPTEVFGSSETGGVAWRRRAEHADIWQTLPGVDIRLDEDTDLLCVRSPHLPDSGVWLETADRARSCDGGASFVLLGRADRIVKIAEKRVSLTAMEQCLQASEWIHTARAVLIERPGLPTRVGMVLELSESGWQVLLSKGRNAVGQALRTLLAGHVERVALPRSWRHVVCMPMNEQGKITQQSLLALFDPMMPQPEWLSRTSVHARARLQVTALLRVLDGHFPQAPLVPGVAQLHWAVTLARQAFKTPGIYARGEVIKFQQPILPGDTVEIQLEWLVDKDAIQFTLVSQRGTHASGRLLRGS